MLISFLSLVSVVNTALIAGSMQGSAVTNPSVARAFWSVIGAVVATRLADTLELKKHAKPSIEETDRNPDEKVVVVAPEPQKATVAMHPTLRRLAHGTLQTLAFAGYISTIYHLIEWYKNSDDWDIESSRWESRLKVIESAEEVAKANASTGPCEMPIIALDKTYSGKFAINKLAKLGARVSDVGDNGEVRVKSLLNPFTDSNVYSKHALADRGLRYIQARIGIQKKAT